MDKLKAREPLLYKNVGMHNGPSMFFLLLISLPLASAPQPVTQLLVPA